jgi:glycosyltransferase involved in cell wall biosynthesis
VLGLAHGYSLSGSGSNFWTAAVARALCRQGEAIHLFSQEREPERFEFIAEAWTYGPDGSRERLFEREVETPGRAVLHRVELDVVPTFVRPSQEGRARWIPEMSGEEVEEYVRRNARVMRQVAETEGLKALSVNHAILLSVAAARVKAETGLKVAVAPHGSALEYVVRQEEEMRRVAGEALAAADGVFVLNPELRDRLRELFGDVSGLEAKMIPLRVGVDTALFRPSGAGNGNGRGGADGRGGTVAFVGRLLAAKGPASLLMAAPRILESRPDARLVVMGGGPIREALERLVAALEAGDREAVSRILEEGDGPERRDGDGEPFLPALRYWERLSSDGALDPYLASAAERRLSERVEFTGNLEQERVAERLAGVDVLVVPSVVAEVGPMVVPEAAAAGAFPMGTDFGGMHHTLNALASDLPEPVRPYMRLRQDPEHTVEDIVRNVEGALAARVDPEVLRTAAIREFGWERIAADLAKGLRGL